MVRDNYNCPLCESTYSQVFQDKIADYEYGAPGKYQWQACEGCGLIRLNPFPTAQILHLAYPEDYHAFVKPQSHITLQLTKMSRKKVAQNLAARLPPGGAILDIGCSTGELLVEIGKRGNFCLFGVEYKPEAADKARSCGITVWQGEFEKADIPEQSMDLIVMQHVLEHVYDPLGTLKKIHRILKPSGLVLGELPNIDCWDAALFGKYWGGGHAPRHLWHFTPKTLRQMLTQCGFEVVSVTPALHTGHWALSIQNALRRKKSTLKGLHSGRTWYYPLFLLLTIPINLIQFILFKTGVMRFEARRVP